MFFLMMWIVLYCLICKVVEFFIWEFVEFGVGEVEGGVGYCEVEYDVLDVMSVGLGMIYMISVFLIFFSFDV